MTNATYETVDHRQNWPLAKLTTCKAAHNSVFLLDSFVTSVASMTRFTIVHLQSEAI